MNAIELKAGIRSAVRDALRGLDADGRRAAADAVVRRILALPEWQAAGSLMLTWPLPDEIAVDGLVARGLAEGRRVGLPAWSAEQGRYVVREIERPEGQWIRGPYGVREPQPDLPELAVGALDLAIVPGVAFDTSGGRVGRGKGFYDRLLARFSGTACGVGFDQQLVPEVPVEPHDVLLNLVVTPSAVCRRPGPR